jgi:hypothetical protein
MARLDAIVTDADQRVALEVIRSLGLQGLAVGAVELNTVTQPLSFVSRYCGETMTVSDYRSEEFSELCRQAKAVFPISSNTVLAMLDGIRPIESKVLLPDLTTFRSANNKYELIQLAQECGIPYPKSTQISSSVDCSKSDFPDYAFPLVLKIVDDDGLYLRPEDRYCIVREQDGFTPALQSLQNHDKDVVLQEYIDGDSYGYSVLYDRKSTFICGIGHRRLRQYPLRGGPSTYCESVSNQELKDSAVKLLNHIKWRGPAMVEFKRDRRDNRFKVIEVNPRYWGSLPLARFSGVNIPYLHYCLLTSEDYSSLCQVARANTKLKFRFMDLVGCLQELRHSNGKITNILTTMRDFFRPSIHDGILSTRDMRPAVRYFYKNLRRSDDKT